MAAPSSGPANGSDLVGSAYTHKRNSTARKLSLIADATAFSGVPPQSSTLTSTTTSTFTMTIPQSAPIPIPTSAPTSRREALKGSPVLTIGSPVLTSVSAISSPTPSSRSLEHFSSFSGELFSGGSSTGSASVLEWNEHSEDGFSVGARSVEEQQFADVPREGVSVEYVGLGTRVPTGASSLSSDEERELDNSQEVEVEIFETQETPAELVGQPSSRERFPVTVDWFQDKPTDILTANGLGLGTTGRLARKPQGARSPDFFHLQRNELGGSGDASTTSTPPISPTPSTIADDEADADRTFQASSSSVPTPRFATLSQFKGAFQSDLPQCSTPIEFADNPKAEHSFEIYTDPIWYSQAIDSFMPSIPPTVATVHYATVEGTFPARLAMPQHSWLPTPLPSATNESATSPDSETDPDRTFEAPSTSTTTLTPPSPRSPTAVGTCSLFLSPPLSPTPPSPPDARYVAPGDEDMASSLAEYFHRKTAVFDGDTASPASRTPQTVLSGFSPEVPLIDVEPPPRPASASASSSLSYTSRSPSLMPSPRIVAHHTGHTPFIPPIYTPRSINSSPDAPQALQSSWASWIPHSSSLTPLSPRSPSLALPAVTAPQLPVAETPVPRASAANQQSQTMHPRSTWIRSNRSSTLDSPQPLLASEYSTSTPPARVSNNSSPSTEAPSVTDDGIPERHLQSRIVDPIPGNYQEHAWRETYVYVPVSEGTADSVSSNSTAPTSPRHVPVSSIYALPSSPSAVGDAPPPSTLVDEGNARQTDATQRHVPPHWNNWDWYTPVSPSDYPYRMASMRVPPPAVVPVPEETIAAPVPPGSEARPPLHQMATPIFGTMEPVVPIPPGATSNPVPFAPQHSALETARASTSSSAYPTSWYSADSVRGAPDFRGAFIAWANNVDLQEPITIQVQPPLPKYSNTDANVNSAGQPVAPATEGVSAAPASVQAPTTRPRSGTPSTPAAAPRPARRLRFAPLPDGTPINDQGAGAVGSGWSGGYLYPGRISPGSTCASGGYSGPQTPVQGHGTHQQQHMHAPFPQEWPFSSYGQGLAQGLQGLAQGYGQNPQGAQSGNSPYATGSVSGFSSTGSSMLRTPVPLGLASYAAMFSNPYTTPTAGLNPNSQANGNASTSATMLTPNAPNVRPFSSGSMTVPPGPLPTAPHLGFQPPSAPPMPSTSLPAMAPPFFMPPFAPAWVEQGWTPSPAAAPPVSSSSSAAPRPLPQPTGPQSASRTPCTTSSSPLSMLFSDWDSNFNWGFNGSSPAVSGFPQGFTPEFEFGLETRANTQANSQSRYPPRWNAQAPGGSTSQQGAQQPHTTGKPCGASCESLWGQPTPPAPPAPLSQSQPQTQSGFGGPSATMAGSSPLPYYYSVPTAQLQPSCRLQHHVFWFEDGNFICSVENTHFRIHQHFLKKYSSFFRNRVFEPVDLYPGYYNTFVLPGVKKIDFEKLLYIFYPTSLSTPDLRTKEDWLSVLRLAITWDMSEIKALALRHLHTLVTSTVERLCLATDFPELSQDQDIQENWLVPGYMELCRRGRPLRKADGENLGLRVVMGVWEVQWRHHGTAAPGLAPSMGPAGYRFSVAAEGSEERLERLVREVFGLL
ncbi:unnamed protein product [Cyclocybe aegerita]|uniref:BTB domain-containing protein n=1 Tax=Cyclocybe aegerita TaxID=1973307 RepID=A0A8S0WWF6_CYCAE|nr:unnamed protein product [Cyclocybe aegerita]